ncbi:MAG: hypothetical protein J5806_02900 [Lentisphaeria bacterium]|nr:hypothetical protein [Lentisphaeria bacterium]
MKIRVVSQHWFKENTWGLGPMPVYQCPDSVFWKENNFISIRHSAETDLNCAIPVDGDNILKLQFDDAVEDSDHTRVIFDGDTVEKNPQGYYSVDDGHALVLFDTEIAGKIVRFIRRIDTTRLLFINCGAGISRSGAVGEVLNDYFNKYLERNELDDEYFRRLNRQIQGNPLVRRILREVLFGDDCM